MISQVAIVRLLEKEKNQWRRFKRGTGGFRNGFIAGLSFAISTIKELGALTQERMKDNPRYLHALFRRGSYDSNTKTLRA